MDQISRLQEYTTDVAHRIALTLEEIRTTAPPMTVEQARNVHLDPEPPERKKFREENTARLKALMSLFLEGDALIGSLPATFATEEEQMSEIRELIKENEAANEKLRLAREKAEKTRKSICEVVKIVADSQFRAHEIDSSINDIIEMNL